VGFGLLMLKVHRQATLYLLDAYVCTPPSLQIPPPQLAEAEESSGLSCTSCGSRHVAIVRHQVGSLILLNNMTLSPLNSNHSSHVVTGGGGRQQDRGVLPALLVRRGPGGLGGPFVPVRLRAHVCASRRARTKACHVRGPCETGPLGWRCM
jgi:hypothetical protein